MVRVTGRPTTTREAHARRTWQTPPVNPSAPSSPDIAVRTEGLGRRFGERWAVRDLSLELRRGEVFGLLGPNGAGKTTTIRLLAALIGPSEGSARVDGLDLVREADGVRARVGVLTEAPGLYEKLSAVRNLDFFGKLQGLPTAIRAERIERLLRLFDLWDRRHESTGTFSKGMKQKLAIARALLHDPSVLFLDEPTAALDPEAAAIVRDAIATLRGQGRTIVLCTHVLPEAERLCDRIGFLRGTLLRVDTPARLRATNGNGVVHVRLAAHAGPDLLAALRAAPAVASVAAAPDGLVADLHDAESDTPALVRALVAAGAAILEVRREAATLEEVYFEVMGTRADGEAAA
jgi:ABC-2 type transport system ATP-binding protein